LIRGILMAEPSREVPVMKIPLNRSNKLVWFLTRQRQ
jgi:hypothetical protein